MIVRLKAELKIKNLTPETSTRDFDIKVDIHEKHRTGLPFLNSRLASGIMLSYLGYQNEVLPLLQTISHRTRAYAVNAKGLPGFVLRMDIMKILKQADAKGQLESVKEW